MTLAEELQWRGQLKDKTFKDFEWLNEPQIFYLGADCSSANSLTIGNLAIYMLARRLRQHGWQAVLLVGGATSMIGDPGGKDDERPIKSRDEILANVAGIQAQVDRLFSGLDYELVNNYDWFKDMNYLEFLRDVGKYFNMTDLVQRDYIAQRIGENGSGISYAEFSYSLIQGYDYWHLYKNYGVVLQIGGSDQWGNMLSGVPLIRKKENVDVHALSMPLIIDKTTGKKFGKSEAGAVWLDPAKTSPTQFYQFWINVDDVAVEDYLKIYTDLNQDELKQVMTDHDSQKSARTAQSLLAREVTRLVHGNDLTATAESVTEYLTGKKNIDDISQLELTELRSEVVVAVCHEAGSILEVLHSSGLAQSLSDAKRLLAGNAVSINGQKISREQFMASDFQNGRLLIKKGKKFKDTALVELP